MDVDAQQVADFYGVTRQTIQNWIRAGLSVKHKGGRGRASIFDSRAVHDWLVQREIDSRVTRDDDGREYDRAKEEARLKFHQANNEALKEKETKGRVVDSAMVVEMCSAGVTNCRNRLLGLDKKLRNEFPGLADEVFDRIYELHEDALEQLGKGGIPRGLRDRISKDMA